MGRRWRCSSWMNSPGAGGFAATRPPGFLVDGLSLNRQVAAGDATTMRKGRQGKGERGALRAGAARARTPAVAKAVERKGWLGRQWTAFARRARV